MKKAKLLHTQKSARGPSNAEDTTRMPANKIAGKPAETRPNRVAKHTHDAPNKKTSKRQMPRELLRAWKKTTKQVGQLRRA